MIKKTHFFVTTTKNKGENEKFLKYHFHFHLRVHFSPSSQLQNYGLKRLINRFSIGWTFFLMPPMWKTRWRCFCERLFCRKKSSVPGKKCHVSKCIWRTRSLISVSCQIAGKLLILVIFHDFFGNFAFFRLKTPRKCRESIANGLWVR